LSRWPHAAFEHQRGRGVTKEMARPLLGDPGLVHVLPHLARELGGMPPALTGGKQRQRLLRTVGQPRPALNHFSTDLHVVSHVWVLMMTTHEEVIGRTLSRGPLRFVRLLGASLTAVSLLVLLPQQRSANQVYLFTLATHHNS